MKFVAKGGKNYVEIARCLSYNGINDIDKFEIGL
jgi:hypothetical protein